MYLYMKYLYIHIYICLVGVALYMDLDMHPRHSFTTRLLHSCMPSSMFAGELTMEQLNNEWADEMVDLYDNGVEVHHSLQ